MCVHAVLVVPLFCFADRASFFFFFFFLGSLLLLLLLVQKNSFSHTVENVFHLVHNVAENRRNMDERRMVLQPSEDGSDGVMSECGFEGRREVGVRMTFLTPPCFLSLRSCAQRWSIQRTATRRTASPSNSSCRWIWRGTKLSTVSPFLAHVQAPDWRVSHPLQTYTHAHTQKLVQDMEEGRRGGGRAR